MAGEEDDDATVRLIKAYIEAYTGRTKINRLLTLADRCGNTNMELQALRMAYEEIMKGEDTRLFKEVVAKIGGRLGPEYGPSNSWAAAVDRRAKLREEKLKNDLNAYRVTSNEENLRKGFNDLGDFYYARGQLDEAFDNYVTSRIYCTTAEKKVEKCILVCIEMGMFGLAASYAREAEQSKDALNTITIAKLSCAAALAYLKDREYNLAAQKFVEISAELIWKSYSEVIAPQDIAIYGDLCAPASFPPPELKIRVTDDSNFQEFLELLPEIRELINSFCSGEYTSCLEILEKLKPHLLIDLHFHDHVEYLFAQIRKKAIINYTLQHFTLDLNIMANVFKTSVRDLLKELKLLVELSNPTTKSRNSKFQHVLQTADEVERELRSMIMFDTLVEGITTSIKMTMLEVVDLLMDSGPTKINITETNYTIGNSGA